MGVAQRKLVNISDAIPGGGFLKDVEAAKILGCSVSRLRQDRFRCRGLTYYKLGRSVLYKLSDLLEYMEKNKVVPGEAF